MLCMTAGATPARRRRVIYPAAKLRAEVSGLESIAAQVVARPRKEAVHRLRSTTRRIEAYLEVVDALAEQEPGFKTVGADVKRVRKLLGRVRRAAGQVRDLDVAREFAKACRSGDAGPKIRGEVKKLRAQLKDDRQREERVLVALLKERGQKLQLSLERLLNALEPVGDVGMSAVELEVLTRDWYARQLKAAELQKTLEDRMHWVRKSAKLARYMAETGLAARVVKEFAAVREVGGQWHDCLNLLRVARGWLGKRSALAKLLAGREVAARSAFEAQIAH